MNATVSANGARYLAMAFAEMRMAQRNAYTAETAEHYTAYSIALQSLQEAQDVTGVAMIAGYEIAESIQWCRRMAEKIAA